MQNQGQLFLGALLVIAGFLFLLGALFDINIAAFCWPLFLIVLGAWLIARPRMVSQNTRVTQRLWGDLERDGAWPVRDEEFWTLLGDIELDMTSAAIPSGETRLRFYTIAGDLELRVPAGVGVSIMASGVAMSVKLDDRQQEGFLSGIQMTSAGYEWAERRIRIEIASIIGDVEVRQIQTAPTEGAV